jgi:hypothetical protein
VVLTCAERDERQIRPRAHHVAVGEAGRIEPVGLGPPPRVAVQGVDGDADQCAARDVEAGQLGIGQGESR